ncbi:MAG: hypothetical protein JO182_28895 [Acidobacteriaceae bacterium]|nr:hypothetical protein [Acidobacteriaceae bacterium]
MIDISTCQYDPFIFSERSSSAAGHSQPGPAEQARFRSMLEHQNCTFSKIEILSHNVGYIKFGAFPPPDICGPTVVATMNFVAHADALIFDVRENHGGDPNMVDFMVSYLFQRPTHINDLTNRHDNETHQYWSVPWVPGPRLVDQPVYVLTSHQTFSGVKNSLSTCRRKIAPPSWAKLRAAVVTRWRASLLATISRLVSPSVGPSILSPTVTGRERG